MAGEWIKEASKLLDKASKLSAEEREALNYFLENVSVGDLRALSDLKAKGIEDPVRVIVKLLEEGFIYRGTDCYNLAEPLRMYIFRRGKLRV